MLILSISLLLYDGHCINSLHMCLVRIEPRLGHDLWADATLFTLLTTRSNGTQAASAIFSSPLFLKFVAGI